MKAATRKFKVGDLVWSKNFGKGDKWVPGVIVEVRRNVNYTAEDSDSDIDLELPQVPPEVSLTPTQNETRVLCRSTKATRRPAWSRDYVSH